MIIEIGVLSILLSSSCPRRGAGECAFSATSSGATVVTVSGSAESKVLFSASLEAAIAADLGTVPDVDLVFVERADDNLLVWILLDNPTKDTREKVFQKQYALIEGFPEVSFDFNLIASGGRNPSEFATEAKLIYSREG